jgi:hypothetical protein
MVDQAETFPTKRFFVEMLTRDITLEDAILDLVDNSIDGVFRQNPTDIEADILGQADPAAKVLPQEPANFVKLSLKANEVLVSDNAGGIDYNDAKSNVFRFGGTLKRPDSSLSVYGIGLKRAVFKLGNEISVESRTEKEGFRVKVDVRNWTKDETNWKLPLERIRSAPTKLEAGTTIHVKQLHPNIRAQITHGNIAANLFRFMRKTYSYFLDRHVAVSLDGKPVPPDPIPLGYSSEAPPSRLDRALDGVNVHIFTGLAKRQLWRAESAGWYILCNGRVIVFADKSPLTEWGIGGFPAFVSKHRGFIGIVLLFSKDPEKLPWTTTKRGLNRDSHLYQMIREDMRRQARPVLDFLNDMYPSDEPEERPQREIADTVKELATLSEIPSNSERFEARLRSKEKPRTVRVQYDATLSEIERAKKAVNKPSWSASRIGRHALEYLLENEGT